ncbi:glycosyltransferase family 4 protein [Oculatella sp. LEGE 06141]|uniref:glycosyltransferase family 4 protein n=1 Tax=Oculatella sp. LEGE 06141 TaxID=1828648 RepID=UPI00187E833C|nr:glycosyltransferase family 4 protein [Oculatella sp. LEGE 06141]MBE9178848.1 glycosyltransferase family 4 protein [Oculatella sp. LEGE 06141]
MKVLHLSTFDIDGGAARAAYRVHQGLRHIGVNSQMLVRGKSSPDPTVMAPKTFLEKGVARLRADLNSRPLKPYRHSNPAVASGKFSLQWFPDGLAPKVAHINPDVINLHWVSDGYLQIETIAKFNKPIVWTLMDMWAFTGGCHYSDTCDRYMQSCGACPSLRSTKEHDLSRKVWTRKVNAWKDVNLTLVSPTHWLADCARSSSLLKNHQIEVIPFCLDTQAFKPIDKKAAREILNFPQDKLLVLFGAIEATKDRRKGFHLLQPALQKLGQTEWREKIELVVFGASAPETPIDLGFKAHYLGRLKDDISLAVVYSAADVMVVPSIQEAFGQTGSEAIACATPVVAFDDTGLKDIVEHQQNGYLAKPFEVDDLARGIAWVLEDSDRHQKLARRAREKAEQEFYLDLQAYRYRTLFEKLLGQEPQPLTVEVSPSLPSPVSPR